MIRSKSQVLLYHFKMYCLISEDMPGLECSLQASFISKKISRVNFGITVSFSPGFSLSWAVTSPQR